MVARRCSFVMVLACCAVSSSTVWAQGGFYQGRADNPVGPTVSPYLNLLQNNNQLNSVPNYQSLVRPLLDQQNSLQRQGNALSQLQQQVNSGLGGRTGSQRGTGHQSFFMNYSHFYPPPRSGGQPGR